MSRAATLSNYEIRAEGWKALTDAYGADRIREFLRTRGARMLSRKTLSFWTVLLDLEGEACFEASSLRRSRPFWNY